MIICRCIFIQIIKLVPGAVILDLLKDLRTHQLLFSSPYKALTEK